MTNRAASIAVLELQAALVPLRDTEDAIDRFSRKDPHLRVYRTKLQEVRGYIESALVAVSSTLEPRQDIYPEHDDHAVPFADEARRE